MIYVIFRKNRNTNVIENICHVRYSLKLAQKRAVELCKETGQTWFILERIKSIEKCGDKIIIQD
jgi:hypothetical protein